MSTTMNDPENLQSLIELAIKQMKQAYCSYSKYQVRFK
jgi:cytidine deaminase